jgi:hypothetical protein
MRRAYSRNITLDYSLDMFDTPNTWRSQYQSTRSASVTESKGQPMCGFTVSLINFETLTAKQKKELREGLRRRKQALQAQVTDVDRALKVFAKKSAKKTKRR